MARWSKNGGPAQALPNADQDATGAWWTGLADNPAGRAACGWAEAGVPDQVTMAQARIALRNAGVDLAELDAWVATQSADTQEFWTRSAVIHRASTVLAAAAAARGWDDAALDNLFIAAAAITA